MRLSEAEYQAILKRRGLHPPDEKPAPQSLLPKSPYRNKTEEDFARRGYLYFSSEGIVEVFYEPQRFYLQGCSYLIDFLIVTQTGMLWVEVKGSRKQKNYRAARKSLRAAAAMYRNVRFYRFFEARKDKGQWMFEEVTRR